MNDIMMSRCSKFSFVAFNVTKRWKLRKYSNNKFSAIVANYSELQLDNRRECSTRARREAINNKSPAQSSTSNSENAKDDDNSTNQSLEATQAYDKKPKVCVIII